MNTTIYTTQHTSNYTIISNDLIVNPLPAVAYRVLTYLLSRPKNWRKNNIDIQKKLGLSAYAVKKALRQIREYGYAIVKRFKDGHTIWHFFDTPKRDLPSATPVFKPQVEIPPVENQPVLINKETIINKEQLPTSPPINAESIVVVFEDSEKIDYPKEIKPTQIKACKAIIKKVKQPELRQNILIALAYAIKQNKVKSTPAYLNGLVTAANNGTFTAINTTTTESPNQATIKQTEMLINQYRDVKRTKPKGGFGGIKAAIFG